MHDAEVAATGQFARSMVPAKQYGMPDDPATPLSPSPPKPALLVLHDSPPIRAKSATHLYCRNLARLAIVATRIAPNFGD